MFCKPYVSNQCARLLLFLFKAFRYPTNRAYTIIYWVILLRGAYDAMRFRYRRYTTAMPRTAFAIIDHFPILRLKKNSGNRYDYNVISSVAIIIELSVFSTKRPAQAVIIVIATRLWVSDIFSQALIHIFHIDK